MEEKIFTLKEWEEFNYKQEQIVSHQRWTVGYEEVKEDWEGNVWIARVYKPATEMQEYDYHPEVKAHPAHLITRTITIWVPIDVKG
jgi:hypothetical protein